MPDVCEWKRPEAEAGAFVTRGLMSTHYISDVYCDVYLCRRCKKKLSERMKVGLVTIKIILIVNFLKINDKLIVNFS